MLILNIHNTCYYYFPTTISMMLDLKQLMELKLVENLSIFLQPISFKLVLLASFLIILLFRWFSTSATTTNDSSLVPPSPPKLPLIGNLHQLGFHPHRSLQTLAQRYGPLMMLHFGSKPVLVVSSAETAAEIFKTHDLIFSDRPKLIFFKKFFYNYKDVGTAPYGEYWRQMRSICVLNLLNNKRVRSFHAVREEETKSMINTVMSHHYSSSPVNLTEMFMRLTNDVICRVAFGRKYSDLGDGRGRMFMELSGELSEMFARVNIGDYIPWLAWFTRVNGLDAKIDNLAKRFDDFLNIVIQEHKDSSKSGNDGINEGEEDQKDFVDVLLWIQKQNMLGFPIDQISVKALILDMFAAGTDTTFTALEWTMSELLRHPKIMKTLQNEIREIVGNKTEITENDLAKMHYLRAVIKETLRLHPPFPLLIPRMSNQDVNVSGYNIKANTQVIVNALVLGRDPKSYNNPEEYAPERFLNNSIDYKGNDFELIPFGAGRRGCPGIQFAIAIEEIALANLVHIFNWVLPDGAGGENLDMTESVGITVHRKHPLKAFAIPNSC